jgi:hypothetical protein
VNSQKTFKILKIWNVLPCKKQKSFAKYFVCNITPKISLEMEKCQNRPLRDKQFFELRDFFASSQQEKPCNDGRNLLPSEAFSEGFHFLRHLPIDNLLSCGHLPCKWRQKNVFHKVRLLISKAENSP